MDKTYKHDKDKIEFTGGSSQWEVIETMTGRGWILLFDSDYCSVMCSHDGQEIKMIAGNGVWQDIPIEIMRDITKDDVLSIFHAGLPDAKEVAAWVPAITTMTHVGIEIPHPDAPTNIVATVELVKDEPGKEEIDSAGYMTNYATKNARVRFMIYGMIVDLWIPWACLADMPDKINIAGATGEVFSTVHVDEEEW